MASSSARERLRLGRAGHGAGREDARRLRQHARSIADDARRGRGGVLGQRGQHALRERGVHRLVPLRAGERVGMRQGVGHEIFQPNAAQQFGDHFRFLQQLFYNLRVTDVQSTRTTFPMVSILSFDIGA